MKTFPMKSFHFYKVLNNVRKMRSLNMKILHLIKEKPGVAILILIQLTSKESQQCNYVKGMN